MGSLAFLKSEFKNTRHAIRAAAATLRRLLRDFPVVLVYGPRQCGKSTLAQAVVPQWRRVDLDKPADLSLLDADIEGFFAANPRRVLIDEAQKLPALFRCSATSTRRHHASA